MKRFLLLLILAGSLAAQTVYELPLWSGKKYIWVTLGPNLKVTNGVIDAIVPEPDGGAHADPNGAAQALGQALRQAVEELVPTPPDRLLAQRAEKFLRMGQLADG